MSRALLYIRVSHDEQVKFGYSLDAQEKALREWCQANDYNQIAVYRDEGLSGGSIEKRLALQRMLKDAKRGDIIVFTKLDRFSRNLLDANMIVKDLDEKGIGIKAIQEDDIDTTTADGKFIFNLKLSLAQREREKTSERIKHVFSYKRGVGEVLNGSAPLGYRIINKHMEVEKSEIEMVVFIFETYDECQNTVATYKRFVEKYGNVRLYPAFKRMLKNELYIGKRGDNNAYCEPIIDKALFDRVQKRLKQNVKYAATGNVYLFSRLIICPACGRTLLAQKNKARKLIYYRCSSKPLTGGTQYCGFKSVREDRLEAELISNIEVFARKELHEIRISSGADHSAEIKKLKAKLERLKDLYIDGDIDKPTYSRKKSAYESDLAKLEQIPTNHTNELVNGILRMNALDMYNELSKTNKQTFWHHFVERIIIDSDGHLVDVEFVK